MKAAIIGCGRIGSLDQFDPGTKRIGICTHAGAYDAHQEVQLVACCDVEQENLNKAISGWEIEGYNDWRQMLDTVQPEIVSICTPTHTHYQITKGCLLSDSVKGIILEKPVAETSQEAEDLLSLAQKTKTKVSVNYRRRFPPKLQAIKDLILSKELGEPILVHGVYTKGIVHNGSHWVDLLRYYFGEPDWLQSEDRLLDHQEDPALDVVFNYASGLRAHLFSFPFENYTIFEMDIILSKGHIRLSDGFWIKSIRRVLDNRPFVGLRSLDNNVTVEDDCIRDWMLYTVEDMVNSIQDDRQPVCTIQDGVRAHYITEMARSSISERIAL